MPIFPYISSFFLLDAEEFSNPSSGLRIHDESLGKIYNILLNVFLTLNIPGTMEVDDEVILQDREETFPSISALDNLGSMSFSSNFSTLSADNDTEMSESTESTPIFSNISILSNQDGTSEEVEPTYTSSGDSLLPVGEVGQKEMGDISSSICGTAELRQGHFSPLSGDLAVVEPPAMETMSEKVDHEADMMVESINESTSIDNQSFEHPMGDLYHSLPVKVEDVQIGSNKFDPIATDFHEPLHVILQSRNDPGA